MTPEELINKYPKLAFIKSPRFQALPREKQEFYLEVLEDADFWACLAQSENPDDGFKFLASTFGLERAQQQADEKGMTGKERDEHLRPHQDLFTQFNPYSGRTSDRSV